MSNKWTMVWATNAKGESVLRDAEAFLDRVEAADGFSAVSDQAKVAARLGSRHVLTVRAAERGVDGRGDTGIVARQTDNNRSNNIIAVGIVGEGELDLVVHPDHRGQGHGTRAMAELLSRAKDGSVKAWVHGDQPAAASILERRSFAPVRTLLRLELDPAALPLEPPAIPAGFTVTHFGSTGAEPAPEASVRDITAPDASTRDEQAAALVRVNAAAFANHPEQGSLTLDGFRELTKEPWFRPEDLVLCFDADGTLAGFTWNKVTGTEAELEAELYVLAVDPEFAGQGLGSILLGLSLVRMRESHPERVSLYVEADNTPALRLYERAGFTVARRSQQWLL